MEQDERETFADRWISEAEQTIKAEADELKKLADRFFVSGPDDKVDLEPLQPPPPPLKQKRRNRKWEPDMLALKHFAKACEAMTQPQRRANIGWLADKYLGIRLP